MILIVVLFFVINYYAQKHLQLDLEKMHQSPFHDVVYQEYLFCMTCYLITNFQVHIFLAVLVTFKPAVLNSKYV